VTVPVWPPELPRRVLVDNQKTTLGEGRLKSATDVGPGKVRRRFSSAVKPVTVNFTLNGDQRIRFISFFEEDTAMGSLPFLFPEVGLYGAMLTTSSGDPLTTLGGVPITAVSWWLVRYSIASDPPSITPMGADWWQGAMALEVLP